MLTILLAALWLLGSVVLILALCRAARRGDQGLTPPDAAATALAGRYGIPVDAAAHLLAALGEKLKACAREP